MILCTRCKTSNRDGSNYCNECGQPLNRAVAPPLVDDQAASAAVARPVVHPEPTPSQPQPSTPHPPANRPTTNHQPPTTSHQPPITNHQPPPTGCGGCSLVLLAMLTLAIAAFSPRCPPATPYPPTSCH